VPFLISEGLIWQGSRSKTSFIDHNPQFSVSFWGFRGIEVCHCMLFIYFFGALLQTMIMKSKNYLILAALVILTTQSVFGQLAYWVNNTGGTRPATVTVNSVSYTTAGTTYTDIQTAINAANAAAVGGVVYITDGRYVNPNSLVANANCNLNAIQSALLSLKLDDVTSGSTFIITSETGDFRTSSAKLVGYGIWVRDNNPSMVTIQGLQLDSVHVNGIYFEAPYGDYGKATISNNKITNTRGHGIKSDSPANYGAWVVTGNCFQNIGYFDARGNCTTPFPASALWLGEPGQITISNNTIKKVKWAGILLDGFSKPNGFVAGTETTVVSGNYISDTQDAGIQIGFSSVGTFFHPVGVTINDNILKLCNMSQKVGIGPITFLNSNVEGVTITNNDISLSFNGIAIEIAGWDNSSTTKNINFNNIYNLMGGYGVTHIANISPNGLYGTGDNLSFYNFDNNYWGAADGPLNAGGAGEELKKDAVNTSYSLGSFDYTPFATSANTVTNTTCATCININWYADTDVDGYGELTSTTTSSCAWPSGYVCNSLDCDDTDDQIGACPQWTGSISTDWSVAGNWNRGVVPTSSDRVLLRSAPSNQPHVTSDPGTPAQCGALTIASGATLTIDEGKALSVSGDTDNDGTIVIKADATGIGSFIDNGTIAGAGNFQMQRYMTGSGGPTPNGRFWYASSPVEGATSSVCNAASIDNKLWFANEQTQNFVEVTDNATALNVTQGFVVRLGATETVVFSGGKFNTGDISASGLTRTGTSGVNRGYNLVGNPYPSSVRWDDLGRTDLEPSIWYRMNGFFDTYNATSMIGTNNNGNGAVDGTIPPTQAFWVRVDADGNTGQLDFENVDRNHETVLTGVYKLEAEEGTVRLHVSNGASSDETIVYFNTGAIDTYDDFDSQKMWVTAIPQLYTTVGADSLVINGLYSIETNPIVDLGIKAPTTGNYTITASSITLTEEVWLEDRLLNNFQHLNLNPVYAFTTNSGNMGDRFALHFGMMAVGIGRDAINGVSTTHVFAADGMVNVSVGEDPGKGMITILDMAGRTVQTAAINGSRTVIATDLVTGIYLVRVETAKGGETHKVVVR
jgi:hypothetical protein